jgi:predicted TIM-barrel fold metal-dependent hydrolase
MAVIDVQVHAYERNHPGRPWAGHLHGPASATGEEMLAALDAVGVDAAIIVSTFNLYRYDASYALEVYAKYPERFRVVKPIDPANPAVDDVLADWAKTKGSSRRQADVAGRADFRSYRPAPQPGVRRRRATWLAGEFPVLGAPG